MEHQIQRQGSEVQEGCEEAPILVLEEDSPEAIEELERRDNLALYESAG